MKGTEPKHGFHPGLSVRKARKYSGIYRSSFLRDVQTPRPWGRAVQREQVASIHQFHPLVLLLLPFPPTKLTLQKSH